MQFPIIEAERIKRELSREDFAKSLGVTVRTVQNWQNGKTEIPMSKMIQLTRIWNCSADYLLGIDTGQDAS